MSDKEFVQSIVDRLKHLADNTDSMSVVNIHVGDLSILLQCAEVVLKSDKQITLTAGCLYTKTTKVFK